MSGLTGYHSKGLNGPPLSPVLRCIESKWYNQPTLHYFPFDSHEMCAIFWTLDVCIGHFCGRLFIFLPKQTVGRSFGGKICQEHKHAEE
jgi:hypothetical protein